MNCLSIPGKGLISLFKLRFVGFFFCSCLIFASLCSFVATTSAGESFEPSYVQKGITFLEDVIGLDLTQYGLVLRQCTEDSYLNVVPQTNVHYVSESNTSNLEVLCTFTNGSLHVLHVLDQEGAPHTTESLATNEKDLTKSFLANYQQDFENSSFYTGLNNMLDAVDTDQNLTTTSGNIKLEVTVSESSKTFVWSYTNNGVEADCKCVSFGYENGSLKYFIDTWNLYKIGSIEINLSEQEAVTIALENANSFTWEIVTDNEETIEINNFNVTEAVTKTLVFSDSYNADNVRDQNLLTLYPTWRIGVGLDKFYPGNVYGIYVDIWADTNQIRHIQTALSALPVEYISDLPLATIEESTIEVTENEEITLENQTNIMPLIVAPLFVVFVFAATKLWITTKKNQKLRLPKLRNYIICGTMVCILTGSTLLFNSIPSVNADIDELQGAATIWGSLAYYKTHDEVDLQAWLCDNITIWFNNNGYNATNYQGTSSINTTLFETIDSSESSFPHVATVWFDHGPGENVTDFGSPEWHYKMMDSNNVSIFDYEIYDETSGKTFFSFISVCMSARITTGNVTFASGTYLIGYPTAQGMSPTEHAVGMPYAWTHHTVENKTELGEDFDTDEHMSIDGYDDPDAGDFFYLGYPLGSAALDQYVNPGTDTVKYFDWVWDFFKYALTYDITINDALDHASMECYQCDFGATDLHTGFTANWPNSSLQENCTLEVYGNGDLNLFQDFVWSFERAWGAYNQCSPWVLPEWDWDSYTYWYEYYGDTSSSINGISDGAVNFYDVIYFVDAYIYYNNCSSLGEYYLCDFDDDGDIEFRDQIVFVDSYSRYNQIGEQRSIDGYQSWYVNATGDDYEMYRYLDDDIVTTLNGESFNFSFCFYPESVGGQINRARAIVKIYYSGGGSTTQYGTWIVPTTTTWYTTSKQTSLNYNVDSVKVIINCDTNFTGWIDLAQLTNP